MSKTHVSRHWWMMVLRGFAGLAFGLAACGWPAFTGAALMPIFGAYALVDGAVAVGAGLTRRGRTGRRWAFLAEGLLGITIGAVALVSLALTALSVTYLIAAWAALTGVVEIAAATQLRREIDDEWLLALGGFASLIVGVLMALQPASGGVAVVWSIGWYALVFGGVLIVWGLRLKGLYDRHQRETEPLRPVRGPS